MLGPSGPICADDTQEMTPKKAPATATSQNNGHMGPSTSHVLNKNAQDCSHKRSLRSPRRALAHETFAEVLLWLQPDGGLWKPMDPYGALWNL